MDVSVKPGKYVVAVSGGVDSVALLNVLSKQKDLTLVVAHFDHGIRDDSDQDRKFVEQLAADYGLAFVFAEGKLGPKASEATAREARYAFLRKVVKENGVQAIIAAHHQDDVLETAIINLLRGTGRKGLTALDTRDDIVRPLLHIPKAELLNYAQHNGLIWREDSTNNDTVYLRNYVRQMIVPKLGKAGREKLLRLIYEQRTVNAQLDALLLDQVEPEELPRQWFVGLPHAVAKEVMAAWLRLNKITNFDAPTLERAVVGAKTDRPGQKTALKNDIFLQVNKDKLALVGRER